MVREITKKGNKDSIIPTAYQQLFELGKRLLAETDINRLLRNAMDSVIEVSNAERGLIILFDETGNILFETARNLKKEDISNPEFEVSRTIIEKAKTEGLPIYLPNALDDPSCKDSESVDRLKLLSVICLPLTFDNRIFGVVYLDNRMLRGAFRQKTYTFIQEFTNFIALAAYKELQRKQLHNQIMILEQELRGKYQFESIVGQHPNMLKILGLVSQVAETDATVLIQGESGTGKELIARAIHYNSLRKDQPFVPINCAALPEQLLESELFGHVRGAFTGALKDRAGWFERADGGTIFLDEINDMSFALQNRLLRVLQAGEYSRVGSSDICKCDVRVVAATSKKLIDLVKSGNFREDVYYRLNVIDMWLPPLRDRKSDIPLLIQHFLKLFSARHKKENLQLTTETEALLMAYNYPGNVRELENIIQRAIILTKYGNIEPHHLPPILFPDHKLKTSIKKLSSFKLAKQQAIDAFERQYIMDCLQVTEGYVRRAAKIAGIDVKNFHEKMKKYKIDPLEYRKS